MMALKRSIVGVFIGIICLTACGGAGSTPAAATQASGATALAAAPSLTLAPAGSSTPNPAAQTAVAQTKKAQPTLKPTHMMTPTPHPCDSSDLLPEVHNNPSTGSVSITVKLSNSGNTPCFLDGAPSVQLVNPQGFALDLQSVATCYRCSASSTPVPSDQAATPAATTAAVVTPAAVNTPPAAGALVTLNPGDTVNLMLVWKNFCDPFPTGGVMIRIKTTGGGNMDLVSDVGSGGHCDAPDQPSTLEVSQFYQ
jgi:hypothetical protein